ncbi:MAG: flagellar biosynthesis protein FlhB [Planctomycetota bacterium]
MAEENSAGEKTEQATARKREESRQQGTVAKSQDLNTAILLVAAFLVLFFSFGTLFERLAGICSRSYVALGSERLGFDHASFILGQSLEFVLTSILPLAITVTVISLLVNFLQVGVMVTTKPVAPDVNRINPVKGLARIFSKRGLMRFLFGILKLSVVGVVLVHGYRQLADPEAEQSLYAVLHYDLTQSLAFSREAIFSLGMKAAVALLILALLDFAYQRWQHEKDLMMTKQEVRDEMKRMEGDPKLKEKRRRMQQRLALQRMMHDVPQADVVITNPTHVSCAIKYDESEMTAPRLLAKGQGHLAHRIRERAAEHGVPIVEQPPLARLIYETTEVGEEVPPQLYQPVAEVLAYVYGLQKRREPAHAV